MNFDIRNEYIENQSLSQLYNEQENYNNKINNIDSLYILNNETLNKLLLNINNIKFFKKYSNTIYKEFNLLCFIQDIHCKKKYINKNNIIGLFIISISIIIIVIIIVIILLYYYCYIIII